MKHFVTKILSIVVLLAVACGVVFAQPVSAVDITSTACEGISQSAVCKDASAGQKSNPVFGPNGAMTRVISVLSIVLAVIAFIVVIIAGIKFATSGGDPSKVASARNTIIYAAVGIVIAAMAQGIVNVVLQKL
jgi:hypothetical protein